MFNPKQIQNYRALKAPEHLKQRIQAVSSQQSVSYSNKHRRLKLGLTLCLLILTIGLFQLTKTPSSDIILVNGQTIPTKPADLVLASPAIFTRINTETLDISIEIETHDQMVISVDEGELQFFDANHYPLSELKECKTKTTLILWKIDTQEISDHVLHITTKDTAYGLLVSYDATRQVWTICRNDS